MNGKQMKELRVAESAGFCFGVRRSVEMAEAMLQEGPCASFGMLIHNTDVVQELARHGMRTVENVEEVTEGERVLIRAHGVPPQTLEALKARNAVVQDATCPKVMHIHRIVEQASANGRFVIIIGMKLHPEVEEISARCEHCVILESAAETEIWLESHKMMWDSPITVVVQTTQTKNNFDECVKVIKKKMYKCRNF